MTKQFNPDSICHAEYKIALERARDSATALEDSEAYWQLCRVYRGQIHHRDQAARALQMIRKV
jgi:hypothetical protein